MPIIKTVLKKVPQQAIVHLVGDGTATIDLNADLKLAGNAETFGGYANANVNINSILYSNASTTIPILVQRDSSNILVLMGNDNWTFAQQFGYVLNQNNTSNISVTIPSPGGTVIIGLSKNAGYSIPDRQNLQMKDR